jgi:hypothetical protein
MRGIDRVLAGIVLVVAVGGAAAFARHSGSDLSAHAVSLTAPPLQHIGAPGSVLFAHTPAPTRVAVDVRRRSRRPQVPVPAATTQPRLVTAVPPRAPAPTPTPAATPKPAPAPVSPPEPSRTLAAVPLAAVPIAPAQPAGEVKGHGRALGHAKQHGHSSPPVVDAPAAPAPADAAVVQPPEPSAVDPAGPGQGHGWGHTKGRATPDGD